MRRVQLYGGGIDSVCIAHLFPPDVKVFFDLGTVENKWEKLRAVAAGAICDNRLFLADQVLANKILPLRNLLLISMASYYGNEIVLGSTAGDTTRDKDAKFLEMTTAVLDYVLGHDPDKALAFHGDGVMVVAPALRLTKAQLVAQYLEAGGDPEVLINSRSCYGEHEQECGLCRSCVRKYVALKLNGLSPNFTSTPDLEAALSYAKARGRGQESIDIANALNLESRK